MDYKDVQQERTRIRQLSSSSFDLLKDLLIDITQSMKDELEKAFHLNQQSDLICSLSNLMIFVASGEVLLCPILPVNTVC
jgi:hypothetical protein